MNTPKTNNTACINPEHPRIKNRDSREQKYRDDAIEILKQGKKKIKDSYNTGGDNYYRKYGLPKNQDYRIHEVHGGHYSTNNLSNRVDFARTLDSKDLQGLSFEDKLLKLIADNNTNNSNTYNIAHYLLPYENNIPTKVALLLSGFGSKFGYTWQVTQNIDHFPELTEEDCEKIAGKMLKENGFVLADNIWKFPKLTQKMVDMVIGYRQGYKIVQHLAVFESKGIDRRDVALKLLEKGHHYLIAEYFDAFGGRDLGMDIIQKVLSTPDDGSIKSYLKNIISQESFDKLSPELFQKDNFVAFLLSVQPDLYDKIPNPNKVYLQSVAQKLKSENIASADIDIKHGVVSYIRGTVRDTGAGMEYGNYVRAMYNGQEKQTHEVYRDGYSASKDNWNLNYKNTKINSITVDGDKIIVVVKAINGDFSRNYTFTFDKAQEDLKNTLTKTEQEQFIKVVEQTKANIIQSETGKYDGVEMKPYFTSEKINTEKGTAVVVLYKQIDYSPTASGNQYVYEAIKITQNGSHHRLDYKAARDYDRKNGNNIVIDAQDYTI